MIKREKNLPIYPSLSFLHPLFVNSFFAVSHSRWVSRNATHMHSLPIWIKTVISCFSPKNAPLRDQSKLRLVNMHEYVKSLDGNMKTCGATTLPLGFLLGFPLCFLKCYPYALSKWIETVISFSPEKRDIRLVNMHEYEKSGNMKTGGARPDLGSYSSQLI